MRMNFRSIGKLGFLLVIIGFFMPMACDMNGFELADTFMQMDSSGTALLLYGVFILALAGLVVGVLLVMGKGMPVIVDWVVLLACIACGLGVFLGSLNDKSVELQSGAYVIVIGWIVALAAQILSLLKKEG